MTKTKPVPPVVFLLVHGDTANRESERQELFTSKKAADKKAAELVRVYAAPDGSEEIGSIRKGRVDIKCETNHFVKVAEITEPGTIQMLWNMWHFEPETTTQNKNKNRR
jgi:hypothetical protein